MTIFNNSSKFQKIDEKTIRVRDGKGKIRDIPLAASVVGFELQSLRAHTIVHAIDGHKKEIELSRQIRAKAITKSRYFGFNDAGLFTDAVQEFSILFVEADQSGIVSKNQKRQSRKKWKGYLDVLGSNIELELENRLFSTLFEQVKSPQALVSTDFLLGVWSYGVASDHMPGGDIGIYIHDTGDNVDFEPPSENCAFLQFELTYGKT